jgi:hypothetical protein
MKTMGEAGGMHGDTRDENRIWVGNRRGKRPLGRPTHRWEDNIKTNFQEL